MTTIEVKEDEIKVYGHSGYAESGHDIVCSAISVLTESLDRYLRVTENVLESTEGDGEGEGLTLGEGDGLLLLPPELLLLLPFFPLLNVTVIVVPLDTSLPALIDCLITLPSATVLLAL